jgi:triosephosphate isomerase
MNGLRADGLALAEAVASAVGDGAVDGMLGVCPPATLLSAVAKALDGTPVRLGGQDCAVEKAGAFTGDISAAMLQDAGCQLTLVGHSERRHGHGESDALVKAKAEAALAAGLRAVVCIGETEDEWSAGRTTDVLDGQLEGSLPGGVGAETMILAYEPVWAIGTGRTPTTLDIEKTHRHLRARLADLLPRGEDIPILYGGSVKADNAATLLAVEDVDGALVGGASLKAEEFMAIWRAAQTASGG